MEFKTWLKEERQASPVSYLNAFIIENPEDTELHAIVENAIKFTKTNGFLLKAHEVKIQEMIGKK